MNSRLAPRVTREPVRQPRADRDLAVPGEQRRRPAAAAPAGRSRGRRPCSRRRRASLADQAARSARPRPFCSSRSTADAGSVDRQRAGDLRRRVGAGVVGDHDPPALNGSSSRQETVQPPDRARQRALLVVDRDDDLDVDAASAGVDVSFDRRAQRIGLTWFERQNGGCEGPSELSCRGTDSASSKRRLSGRRTNRVRELSGAPPGPRGRRAAESSCCIGRRRAASRPLLIDGPNETVTHRAAVGRVGRLRRSRRAPRPPA